MPLFNELLIFVFFVQPKYVIIENPQTGLLKDQEMMRDIIYDDVDYCKYGMPYRKRTRLWNNILYWVPRPICNKDCGTWTVIDTPRLHNEGLAKEHQEQGHIYISKQSYTWSS